MGPEGLGKRSEKPNAFQTRFFRAPGAQDDFLGFFLTSNWSQNRHGSGKKWIWKGFDVHFVFRSDFGLIFDRFSDWPNPKNL